MFVSWIWSFIVHPILCPSIRSNLRLRKYDRDGGGWIPRIISGKTDNNGMWPLNHLASRLRTLDKAETDSKRRRNKPLPGLSEEQRVTTEEFEAPWQASRYPSRQLDKVTGTTRGDFFCAQQALHISKTLKSYLD